MNASISQPVRLDRATKWGPLSLARATGIFWLGTMVAGLTAVAINTKLVVSGDAAATAANVLTHASLLQTGFALYLVEMVCQVSFIALFYLLLKPAGNRISLLAAFIGLTAAIIKTFSRLFFIAPLFVLGGDHYLNVFTTGQLHAFALLFFKINNHGAALALVFFGFYGILQGYLTIRSTFLPKFLGVLSILYSLGLLCFLYPPLGYRLFVPYVGALALVSVAAWIFWLLVFGVNEQRWSEQANATAT
ncbi:MAG: DUF4386 domain-containing protein [Gammaproteobacteria bacterium]